MSELALPIPVDLRPARGLRTLAAALFALLLTVVAVHAQSTEAVRADEKAPLVVEGVNEGDVFGMGKSVLVKGTVKHGVIAFGGDVVVEGTVEGDVAAFGGSVVQRESARIGGDVMVIGGAYHHDRITPDRAQGSMTMMYAGYEQELRNIMRDPATLLAPKWSAAYLGLRLLAALFWFIASLALTAVMPGVVSRAVARLQLTNLRVAIIGVLGAIVIVVGVPACLYILPESVGILLGLMALLLLIVATLFGRVAIHAATGRWLQRKLLPEGRRSESVALLVGTMFWTFALSLPFVWPVVITGLMITSLGLTLTARYRIGWKRAQA